ncbi:MAG: hypothetical protein WB992_18440 [Bryobacteraceae bacterium]
MTRVRSSSFKYYIHDAIEECRLQLLGELSEADVAELSGCWGTARTTLGSRKLVLDLRALKAVDEAGKQWLISMAAEGASYLPDGFLRHGLVGQAAEEAAKARAASKSGWFGKLFSILKGGATPAESTLEP